MRFPGKAVRRAYKSIPDRIQKEASERDKSSLPAQTAVGDPARLRPRPRSRDDRAHCRGSLSVQDLGAGKPRGTLPWPGREQVRGQQGQWADLQQCPEGHRRGDMPAACCRRPRARRCAQGPAPAAPRTPARSRRCAPAGSGPLTARLLLARHHCPTRAGTTPAAAHCISERSHMRPVQRTLALRAAIERAAKRLETTGNAQLLSVQCRQQVTNL